MTDREDWGTLRHARIFPQTPVNTGAQAAGPTAAILSLVGFASNRLPLFRRAVQTDPGTERLDAQQQLPREAPHLRQLPTTGNQQSAKLEADKPGVGNDNKQPVHKPQTRCCSSKLIRMGAKKEKVQWGQRWEVWADIN